MDPEADLPPKPQASARAVELAPARARDATRTSFLGDVWALARALVRRRESSAAFDFAPRGGTIDAAAVFKTRRAPSFERDACLRRERRMRAPRARASKQNARSGRSSTEDDLPDAFGGTGAGEPRHVGRAPPRRRGRGRGRLGAGARPRGRRPPRDRVLAPERTSYGFSLGSLRESEILRACSDPSGSRERAGTPRPRRRRRSGVSRTRTRTTPTATSRRTRRRRAPGTSGRTSRPSTGSTRRWPPRARPPRAISRRAARTYRWDAGAGASTTSRPAAWSWRWAAATTASRTSWTPRGCSTASRSRAVADRRVGPDSKSPKFSEDVQETRCAQRKLHS